MPESNKKRVVVVGGGLVGALNACFLAKRGHRVDLYEMRPDIRRQDVVRGRSINLALSHRGREALKAVGLEDRIVNSGTPMYARMIHDLRGNRSPIYYGRKDQYILSTDRRRLNETLLTAAESYREVEIHFQHTLSSCDFDKKEATFINGQGEKVIVSYDLIVGCDGAHSALRRQMTKSTLLNFQQEYIPHGYLELCIPATKDGNFLMEKNYLHIWPRNTFMMIALPNSEDHTFVVTLFLPFKQFEKIHNEHDLLAFFEKEFPDAVPLMGREFLIKTFFSRKPLPLVTVKCSPYHVGDAAVIMGDAAHAMLPFYGQGMNCGFEDCLVFESILDQYGDDFAKALPEFTRIRNDDAKAICDLALQNYIEMRSSVNSRLFLIRKRLDNALNWLMPKIWIPLYSSVAFTRIPYAQCVENRRWQDKILTWLMSIMSLTAVGSVTIVTWQRVSHSDSFFSSWIDQLSNILQRKFE